MKRIDSLKHIDRWYLVTVTRDLFSPIAVLRSWGNRRNSHQRVRIQPMPNVECATTAAAEIVARKVKRGYMIVASRDDPLREFSRPLHSDEEFNSDDSAACR